MSVKADKALCVGCGCCMDVCSAGALELDQESGKIWVCEQECLECGSCIGMCPAVALSMEGRQGLKAGG